MNVRRTSLFGIVILVGAAALALLGTEIATFAWEEGLRHQNVGAISIPELEPVSDDVTEFQLVVKEPEVKLECRPELMSERAQSLPDFEVILVNELPDPHAPELVTFFGCPLADKCTNRATETY